MTPRTWPSSSRPQTPASRPCSPGAGVEPEDVRVYLHVDGTVLHIFARNAGGRLIPIAERSAGLRQFVALLAFIEHEAADEDVILLVDEAEAHLHYDAQADLVRVFSKQTVADKIIYTTHSAGCLPLTWAPASA